MHTIIGISSFFQQKCWTFYDRAFYKKDCFKFIFAITVGIVLVVVIFCVSKIESLVLDPSSSLAAIIPLAQISCLLSVILTELEGGSTGGIILLVATGWFYLT